MNFSFKNTSFLLRVFFVILGLGIIGFLWQLNNDTMITVKSPGGSIHEGIIGAPRFINPVLAQTQVDLDITRLVFSPLLSIDRNGSVDYILADDVEKSNDGLVYTLSLKNDLHFDDGTPLTADDVVFTIDMIQDPLITSPLQTKWQGVQVAKVDARTVTFTLAKPFSDFLYNLEIGVLPKHIWENINPQEFIFSTYNTTSVGSGPYQIRDIRSEENGVPNRYTLKRSQSSPEKPYIETIVFNFYDSQEELLRALKKNDIDASYGISPESASLFDSERIYSATLPRVFALFFNQEKQEIFQSKNIRKAISYGIDAQKITTEIFNGFASPTESVFGFRSEHPSYDTDKARSLIEKDGWTLDERGVYVKHVKDTTKELGFAISIPNIQDMKDVAEAIKTDLANIGMKVTIRSYDQGNFNQNVLRPREYESILFGYEIEKPSDLYAFWHSSQISDPGLNISLFEDSKVDTLLQSLRSNSHPNIQEIDQKITQDFPAAFLYSPSYIYVLPPQVRGSSFSISKSSDRFNTINDWYIHLRHIWPLFSSDE